MTRRLMAIAIALLLTGAACSNDEPETAQQPERGIIDAPDLTGERTDGENEGDGDDEDAVVDDATSEDVIERLEGTIVDPLDLEPPDCFNEYQYFDRSQTLQQVTTRVECTRPHDKQMFAAAAHPASDNAPFPGQEELSRFARKACFDAFEEYVGVEYVLSQLEIGIFQPTYETWINDDKDRQVNCYVQPPSGSRLQGSMEEIGL